MIPYAVELTDFLSHRSPNGEPVTFDFEGAVLWSVAGDNGAGKSAIFDAITWTLYGQHRGGTQDARRLISHGADSAHAAFAFAVDGERYRVERSIRRRGGGRRAAMRWNGDAARWEELPDTTSESGFAAWRDALLGLSYEAFTHAVLLIQGGSDRLVASGARERFEILAQLVDLTAYQRLERRARERALDARARGGAYAAELARLPEVEPERRTGVEAELERAAAARAERQTAWQAQVAVLEGARVHAALVDRRAAIEPGIAAGEALVQEAERIRAEAAEAAALAAARPHLEAGIAALTAAAAARDRDVAVGARGRGRHAGIDAAALRRAATAARRARLTAVRAAGVAGERAAARRRILPSLETALQRRLELLDVEEAAAQTGSPAAAAAAVAEAGGMLAQLVAARDDAHAAERDGERALARASAAVERADAALAESRAGRREVVCARCGQQVRPAQRRAHLAHLRAELTAGRKALRAAQAALAPLGAARREADAAVERARAIVAELERAHDRAHDAERAAVRAREAAGAARTALRSWRHPRAAVVAKGGRTEVEALRAELRAASADADREERELADAAGRAEEAAQRAAEAASEARRAEIELAQVPGAWAERARAGEPELPAALAGRLVELTPVAERLQALQAAESSLAELRAAHAELSAQLEALPREHAVGVSAAEARLARRAQALEDATALVRQVEGRLRELDLRERELGDLRERVGAAAREERLAARLATLLGRQGIQGHLIVRAAHGLERLANETLRALSGGALELEIAAEERRGRDEIVISARDLYAGGERTDASFLSGSEKFRVCVALAAAIGSYASGRPAIESLIIDEGFGSLDEAGRDEMIDELQRLAQLLKRVIVVSHQSEFHNRARFPHGYRLRRDGTVTEVERFV
ncbi:MAG TPA: SMC family ATPase [Conexibacter sp.]